MGLLRATATVAGIIIGASIFVQPSVVLRHVPTAAGAYAAWALAGTLTLVGALVAAELASALPRSGGVYVFLSEAWSPSLGFLWGWAMLWSMHSGIVAAIAVVLGRYVAWFVPLGAAGTKAVAIAAILLLTAVNYVGVRQGSALQTALTIAKVGAVVAIVAVGFALGPRAAPAAAPAPPGGSPAGLVLALGAGLFAFGGWHMVTYTAGETVAPERTIPRALVIGTLLVTACYLALNAVYFRLLPLDVVRSSTRVAADAADAALGRGGGAVMAGVVVLSTLGALNGVVLTGPRVYHAMARDGLLFRWLGEVHGRFRTPHRAILLQAAWASVLVATGTYETLFAQVVYTEWVFFALMAAGLLVLRRRAGYHPRFSLRGGAALPALFAAAALLVVVIQIANVSARSLIGLALVLLGVPVYVFTSRRGAER